MTRPAHGPSPTGPSRSVGPRRSCLPRVVLAACAAVALAAALWSAESPQSYALPLLAIAGALVVALAAWLESGPVSAKELAVVATVGGAAAASRVLFAAVPNVKPVTVFDVAHATGNAVFALVAGAELWRVLERYARRLRTEVVWA